MSDKVVVALVALMGAIVGGGFTVCGQYIQTKYQATVEENKLIAECKRERVRLSLEAARQHYKADTDRVLGVKRFHGKPLASYADYVAYHHELWKAVEGDSIDEHTDSTLKKKYPRLSPDYLSIPPEEQREHEKRRRSSNSDR